MGDSVELKIPPNSKEGEMLVIGSMLSSVNSLNIASELLEEIDFYYKEHRVIFSTLKEFYKSDQSVDVYLVSEELKRKNLLKTIGDVEYLMTLVQYAGTSTYIEEYVDLIKDKSTLRKIIKASQEIEQDAFKEPKDVENSLDSAQQKFFKISQNVNKSLGVTLNALIAGENTESGDPFISILQGRQELFMANDGKELPTEISSGFSKLDKIINGLTRSNLIIIAARPAMGKTALALNIAAHVAFNQKMPVAFFSLEMSAEQILERLVGSQSHVDIQKIQSGAIDGNEFQRILESVDTMQKHTMIIDDQPSLKISDLRARARRMKEIYGIKLIVIDYLQLISAANVRAIESRQLEISEISRMLKTIAKELNIPVLCLAQLSRRVEERMGHKPMLSDLRESGSIEQDADVILFLLRREYYDPNDKPGLAEIIVGKNRHGPVGTVSLSWLHNYQQFHNYQRDDDDKECNDQTMKKSMEAFDSIC